MTFFDDLGLKAAEQLEGSLGPYVALASYKRMLGARRPTRTKAALGVVRCAAALADAAEIEQSIAVAAKEADELGEAGERDALDAFVGAACGVALSLARTNGRAALELARTLHWRAPTAARAYLVARLEDDAGTRALDAWTDATRLAASEAATSTDAAGSRDTVALYRAALCRWIELYLAAPERVADANVRGEILSRALELDVDGATPAQRLLVARARLLSPSKFQRASGLSLLVDLSRASNEGVRRHAVLACARHADAAARLEPIEQERVTAALRNWADEAERESALARHTLRAAVDALSRPAVEEVEAALERVATTATELAPQVHRLRALLREPEGAGGEAAPAEGTGSGAPAADPLDVSLGSLAIDAILALRAGRPADAARALERASGSAATATSAPAAVSAAVILALDAKDVPSRRAAASLAHTLFRRRVGAPREGWAPLGVALARAGFFAEARDVLEEAERLREPGAAGWAGEVERRLGYLALAKGDRAAALESLRRAAALLSRAAPSDPHG